MGKRLPPLNSLKAFEAAAKHLSFTKAADELFVTQAAISHQIKLLEDFLGFPLFVRKNRALLLTELGQTYFLDIRNILRKLADVTDNLKQQNKQKILAIKIPQTFGMHWLVPKLSQFKQKHPDIDVRINGASNDEGLLTKEIDVAVYYGRGNWQGLKAERLADANLVILAASSLLQEKPINTFSDLIGHTRLHIHNRDNWQILLEKLNLEQINLQHDPVFSHTFMALQAAIHGQGIVLANEFLAQQEIKSGHLQQVLNVTLPDSKAFFVVYDPNREQDPVITAFRDWVFSSI